MPGPPLKVATPAYPTLRRLSPFDNPRLRRRQSFQFFDESRNLFVSLDPAKLFLRDQEPRSHPALPLVAAVPAFHVPANLLDNRERRLDHIGACGSRKLRSG